MAFITQPFPGYPGLIGNKKFLADTQCGSVVTDAHFGHAVQRRSVYHAAAALIEYIQDFLEMLAWLAGLDIESEVCAQTDCRHLFLGTRNGAQCYSAGLGLSGRAVEQYGRRQRGGAERRRFQHITPARIKNGFRSGKRHLSCSSQTNGSGGDSTANARDTDQETDPD